MYTTHTNKISPYDIIHLFHNGEGDMNIKYPRENHISKLKGNMISFFWGGGNYLSLQNVYPINCL